jgi:hypothetical protein
MLLWILYESGCTLLARSHRLSVLAVGPRKETAIDLQLDNEPRFPSRTGICVWRGVWYKAHVLLRILHKSGCVLLSMQRPLQVVL